MLDKADHPGKHDSAARRFVKYNNRTSDCGRLVPNPQIESTARSAGSVWALIALARLRQVGHLAESLLVDHLGEVASAERNALKDIPELGDVGHASQVDVAQRFPHGHLAEVASAEGDALKDVSELLRTSALGQASLVHAFLTGTFAKYPEPKAMHWSTYQMRSHDVISTRPASLSAFFVGILAK